MRWRSGHPRPCVEQSDIDHRRSSIDEECSKRTMVFLMITCSCIFYFQTSQADGTYQASDEKS